MSLTASVVAKALGILAGMVCLTIIGSMIFSLVCEISSANIFEAVVVAAVFHLGFTVKRDILELSTSICSPRAVLKPFFSFACGCTYLLEELFRVSSALSSCSFPREVKCRQSSRAPYPASWQYSQ